MAAGFTVTPDELDSAGARVSAATSAFPDATLMGLKTDGDSIGRALLASSVSDFIYAWQLGIGYLIGDGTAEAANLHQNAQLYQAIEQDVARSFNA